MSTTSPSPSAPMDGGSRRRALVAAGLVAWFALAWWFALGLPPTTGQMREDARVPSLTDFNNTAPGGDVQLYVTQVEAMRRGQGYYDAASDGLRRRGYPMQSVFNWRQPLLPWTLTTISPMGARLLMALLAGLLIWQTGLLQRREPLALVPMANTVLGLLVPTAVYLSEAWAGACLGLSALAYARGRLRPGAGWALAALFIRELAGPYCLVAACVALYRRRWNELIVWAVGGAAYAIYFSAHAMQVLSHIRPDDRAQTASWIAFGGLTFLLDAWRTNGLLLLAPPAVVALLAVSIVVAWWNRALPDQPRWLVLGYSLGFLIVGQRFNGYWGLLLAPTVSLWLAHSPQGLRALWSPATQPTLSSQLDSR